VSISISGQNDRWAQLSAYQPPPASQAGQNGGWNSISGTAASSGSTGSTPFAGGTSGALSDGMSFALMALSGGWGSGQAASVQTADQSSATSGASSASSASPGLAPITQNGTSSASQLMTSLQSLLSALTGTPPSSTGGQATSATATSSETGVNTGNAASSGIGSAALPDLQTVGSDLDTNGSTSSAAQPWGAAGPPGGPPPWNNGISNTGSSATSGTGGWNPSSGNSLQQQLALSAYAANASSGLTSSATSALAGMNV